MSYRVRIAPDTSAPMTAAIREQFDDIAVDEVIDDIAAMTAFSGIDKDKAQKILVPKQPRFDTIASWKSAIALMAGSSAFTNKRDGLLKMKASEALLNAYDGLELADGGSPLIKAGTHLSMSQIGSLIAPMVRHKVYLTLVEPWKSFGMVPVALTIYKDIWYPGFVSVMSTRNGPFRAVIDAVSFILSLNLGWSKTNSKRWRDVSLVSIQTFNATIIAKGEGSITLPGSPPQTTAEEWCREYILANPKFHGHSMLPSSISSSSRY